MVLLFYARQNLVAASLVETPATTRTTTVTDDADMLEEKNPNMSLPKEDGLFRCIDPSLDPPLPMASPAARASARASFTAAGKIRAPVASTLFSAQRDWDALGRTRLVTLPGEKARAMSQDVKAPKKKHIPVERIGDGFGKKRPQASRVSKKDKNIITHRGAITTCL